MDKLCFVLIFAVLGAEVLSMSFRVKRQDNKDLEDRYGYNPIEENGPVQNPPQNNNENNTQSPEACRLGCPVTSEYNPVCGTDNVTYQNPGRLLCAQACGTTLLGNEVVCKNKPNTTLVPKSSTVTNATTPCIPTSTYSIQDCIRTYPVTSDYNPVCGSNGVTYDNPGRLLRAQACGVDVKIVRHFRCPPSTPAPSV